MIDDPRSGAEVPGFRPGSDSAQPRVDVLMPTRDASWMLDEAIASILSQRGVSLRLLIVDDCRELEESERLAEIAESDQRIVIIRSDGIGIVDALNTGLAHVEAKFCARMDADDVSLPERLRIQAEWLDDHPDHVLVGGLVRYFDESGALLDPVDWEGLGSPLNSSDINRRLRDHNCIFHPTVMFRAEAVRQVGGYRSNYPHNEDYDLWLRLAETGKLENLPFPVLLYRIHGGQVGQLNADAQEESRLRLIAESFASAPPVPDAMVTDAHITSPSLDRKVRDYSCILEINSFEDIDRTLANLTDQHAARLRELLILHPPGLRQMTRIRRTITGANALGISVSLLSRDQSSVPVRKWLEAQLGSRPVFFMSASDEASLDRVVLQSAALDFLPGGWSLGMATVDNIPRSGLFPAEYFHRRPELIAELDDEHVRSSLCLSAEALLDAISSDEHPGAPISARAVAKRLSPTLLVELPMEISRIRATAIPARRRFTGRIEIGRRRLRRLLARTARSLGL